MNNEWYNKVVLVTGAGGFIGSHLTEMLLQRGARVRALLHYSSRADAGNLEHLSQSIRDQLEVVRGDVCDPFFMIRSVRGCQCVFHLAALIGIPYSYVAPASYLATNTQGTINFLEACRSANISSVVHTSTSECYGTAQYAPIDEAHPLQAQSPYAASKIGADKMAEAYHRSFGLPVRILRPFNTYGPRQSARAVIPTIVSQLLWGGPELSLGSLSPVRDFTYVTDTCEGFLRIATCDQAAGEVVQLGTGEAVSIGQLVDVLREITDIHKPVRQTEERTRPDNSEVMRLISTPKKARDLLGWHPTISLREGLTRVVSFVKAHPEFYRSQTYAI